MKRRRGLSAGEDALWRKVTRDVRPIRKKPPRAGDPGPELGETSRETAAPVRSRRPGPSVKPTAPRARKGRSLPALQAGDPALDKKARRGRIAVEKTLDLHGLREIGARTRLIAFIETAAREGCRCVLVITGKGQPASEADPFAERPRGVIRRRFEEWIDEEPLRSLVTRASQAQPKDGGAGAFYVFLKAGRKN